MTDNVDRVEAACAQPAATGQAITFGAIAEHTGISRTTLYRSPELWAVIEDHRAHTHDRRTLTGLGAEIAHLRTALEAVADRVRRHEERLRQLETNRQRHREAN